MFDSTLLVSVGLAILAIFGANAFLASNNRKKIADRASKQQTEQVSPAKPGESAIRRSVVSPKQLLTTYDPAVLTLSDLWDSSVKKFADKDCLGFRPFVEGKAGPYQFVTYKQVNARVVNFASGLSKLGVKTDANVGIFSVNRLEWMITDLACIYLRCPTVSLYETQGHEAVQYVMVHSEIVALACGSKQVASVLSAFTQKPSAHLKTIVTLDGELTPAQREELKKVGLTGYTMAEVEALGAQNRKEQRELVRPEHIYTIMYTSGTTGNPKGVIQTHSCYTAQVAAIMSHSSINLSREDVHLSYLPLAHVFERVLMYTVFAVGANAGFHQGNINELINDINALRPTYLPGVPRVWSRIRDKIHQTVRSSGALRQKLFEYGYSSKVSALTSGSSTAFWDAIIFSKLKKRVGGRVRFILSAAAPLDPKLNEFLRICFCCEVLEAYGLTESTGGAFATLMEDTTTGHVGTILPHTEVKLIDVPEANFFASEGKGEVMFRGPCVFKGYFKEPEKTKETIEADGWMHTGDVGRWNSNGTLSIIDRKKSIFKLSQGEYVSAEYLEGIFGRSPFVGQIWVHGSSFNRSLVAVVVPQEEYLQSWAKENNLSGDYKTLVANHKVKESILQDLERVGKEAKIHGFEFVKGVHLTSDPFTVDNDSLTPTFKLRRHNLVKTFEKSVSDMYRSLGE
eukprot:TRINITY_DN95_c0_g1_i1.p1 TRINITY_DN95_c0_g1~~TRINITY_DN95_c0_g1_i1.p1  ORF type:complete len:683 (+),score=236.38 TRINITY_DN95_c0_g1_i1:88-2136(+)